MQTTVKIRHKHNPSIETILARLNIEPCDRVVEEINKHTLSQVLAALNLVDSSYENITDRVSYLIKVLPSQRREKLGTREPEIGAMMRQEYDRISEEIKTQEYQMAWANARSRLPKYFKRRLRNGTRK